MIISMAIRREAHVLGVDAKNSEVYDLLRTRYFVQTEYMGIIQ